MPSIWVKGLSEDQLEELRVKKARGRYSSWREMFLKECGVQPEGEESEDETKTTAE